MKYSLCCSENSSSLESCKDFCVTSPGQMTSVRSCYCKQEENVSRKKNDVITDGDQHLPTAVSKRLIVKNKVCRSSRESPIRERSDEKMVLNNFLLI